MSHEKMTESDGRALLRHLPRVDDVLNTGAAKEAAFVHGPGMIAHQVRATLEALRRRCLSSESPPPLPSLTTDAVAESAISRLALDGSPYPRVLNGTGVILHSGLGRAPIPKAARDALLPVHGYGLLEVDREHGERLSRDTRIGELLSVLTGAPASLVVNNCAAATLLILTAMARGKEVICSRGEMVEIGGSFRIPEVMEASGARLVSVGATNHTYARDYENAITPDTAALLVVHTSNYRIMGFTSTPPLEEIVAVGRRHGLPVIHDLGSGSLLSPEELGLGDEPPVNQSLKAGCDVVCMSGDKLLGGPQAGIILGTEEWVKKIRRHPLARAVRIDKMRIAALAATLGLFLDRPRLRETHPVTRMLMLTKAELQPRAEGVAATLTAALPDTVNISIATVYSETGSGALPTLPIESVGVLVGAPWIKPNALARALRLGAPSLFTRIVKNRVCLDLRTLAEGEEQEAAQIVIDVLSRSGHGDQEP